VSVSTLAVYLRLVRVQVRGQLQYRTSFALSLTGTFLFTALDFAAILILFQNVSSIAGWTASQVALLYAASSLSFALVDMVVGSLDRLPVMVRDGSFDTLLIRPGPAFFQLLATDFMFRRAGRLLQALLVLVIVAVHFLDITWTPARVGMLLVAVLSGALIMGSVWVVAASVSFWIDEAAEFVNAFTSGAAFLAQYPVEIYTDWLRRLVFFLIPIGFVIYLPASWLLGKPDVSGLPEVFRFASPLVAALAVLVAATVWRLSIRRYRSVGG
jgi:ABC-2 type transport system permease protein